MNMSAGTVPTQKPSKQHSVPAASNSKDFETSLEAAPPIQSGGVALGGGSSPSSASNVRRHPLIKVYSKFLFSKKALLLHNLFSKIGRHQKEGWLCIHAMQVFYALLSSFLSFC